MVPVDRLHHDLEKFLAVLALAGVRTGCVVQLDAGLCGESFDSGNEVEMLGLLDEVEDITLRPAPKAHVSTCLVVDAEGAGALGMERTEPDLAATAAAQLCVGADEIGQRGGGTDTLDVVLRNRHGSTLVPRRADDSRRRVGQAAALSDRIDATTDTVRMVAMTASEAAIGMCHQYDTTIFTPTKARMTPRPVCR